jgi:hypothetical protein
MSRKSTHENLQRAIRQVAKSDTVPQDMLNDQQKLVVRHTISVCSQMLIEGDLDEAIDILYASMCGLNDLNGV